MKKVPLSLKKLFIVVGIILVLFIGGYLVWQSFEEEPEQVTLPEEPGLGELGAKCGGRERLPCKPGLICSNYEPLADEYGECVTDERDPAELMIEGQPCDRLTRSCGPGLKCKFKEGEDEGVCVQIIPSNRPFIMSVIPEGMELISGAYKADPGTKVTVRVHALNVDEGDLYLKPLWVSHSGVMPREKVSGLRRQGESNEFIGTFTVEEDLGASLIAIMRSEDGQEAELSINVAATIE